MKKGNVMSIFNNLVGKRINGIFLGNDAWTVVFRTTEGEHFRYDTGNDCCNSVWVNHITGVDAVGKGNSFDLLRGALVTGAEDKEWTENRDGSDEGHEVIQDGFYTLHTDRGYIDIEVRNSHNGYYGGSFEFADEADLNEIEDLKEVNEDF
jgi:hypothetical protein